MVVWLWVRIAVLGYERTSTSVVFKDLDDVPLYLPLLCFALPVRSM